MRQVRERPFEVGNDSGDCVSLDKCSMPSGAAFEKHFSAQFVADLWDFGVDKVRELFRDEPTGVIIEGSEEGRYKRGYKNMRISESAIRRVHAKLTARCN